MLRRQRVHTDMRFGTPLIITRTFCVFGAQVRRVLRLEWLTLFPYTTPLPQISQNLPLIYHTSFKAVLHHKHQNYSIVSQKTQYSPV